MTYHFGENEFTSWALLEYFKHAYGSNSMELPLLLPISITGSGRRRLLICMVAGRLEAQHVTENLVTC
jgi:hypothetical protein